MDEFYDETAYATNMRSTMSYYNFNNYGFYNNMILRYIFEDIDRFWGFSVIYGVSLQVIQYNSFRNAWAFTMP